VYKAIMLLLVFLLELCALVALGWAGFALDASLGVRIAVGVGLPLVAAVAWGLFAAPRARIKLPPAGVTAVKVLVFGTATLALFAIGHELLAAVFALVVLVVHGLVRAGDLDAGMREGAGMREETGAPEPVEPDDDQSS
jgi:hypothetical protein